jgi:hypothetical protein
MLTDAKTLTEAELKELDEAEKKATLGPWEKDTLCDVSSNEGDVTFKTSIYGNHENDAQFIALARNKMRSLLDEVKMHRELCLKRREPR